MVRIWSEKCLNLYKILTSLLTKDFCINSKIIVQTFEGIFLNLENTMRMQEIYHTMA